MPLDGTPLAEEIFEPAVALGELMGAEYALVRVIKPILPVYYPAAGAEVGANVEEISQQLLSGARFWPFP